ncbi:MAG: hypothetical protein AAF441_19155 [Pseudomonadota bacterium]
MLAASHALCEPTRARFTAKPLPGWTAPLLHGLHLAPHGLHLAAHGLHAPHGLHFAALQGLHAPQGLHFAAPHGLQAEHGLQDAKRMRFCAFGLPWSARFWALGLSVVFLTAAGLALLAAAGPETDVRPRATPTVIGTTATVERSCFLLIIRFLPKMIKGFDECDHTLKVNQRADGLDAGTMRAFQPKTYQSAHSRVFT